MLTSGIKPRNSAIKSFKTVFVKFDSGPLLVVITLNVRLHQNRAESLYLPFLELFREFWSIDPKRDCWASILSAASLKPGYKSITVYLYLQCAE